MGAMGAGEVLMLPSFCGCTGTNICYFICLIFREEGIRCSDSKILLEHIFVKYCWKPHHGLIFPLVQLPAFDILFV